MEVKTKTRVSIIPASQNSDSSSPAAPSAESTSPAPITVSVGGSGGPSPIKIGAGPSGAPSSTGQIKIGTRSGPPGGGSSFPPRPAGGGFSRGPRRDLSKFNTDEHRINERIRVPQVRLIDHLGAQQGVTDTAVAMQMARDVGLDLVEISPNAAPPVCKILDYGKFKYEKKKKDHEAKKKQVVVKVKEIQLRPNTDEHDLDYKFKNVKTFLEEGDKAKITMMFRGREVAYVDAGYKTMQRLIVELGDMALVEAPPKLEGKKLIMVIGPNPKYKKPPKPKMAKMDPPTDPNAPKPEPKKAAEKSESSEKA